MLKSLLLVGPDSEVFVAEVVENNESDTVEDNGRVKLVLAVTLFVRNSEVLETVEDNGEVKLVLVGTLLVKNAEVLETVEDDDVWAALNELDVMLLVKTVDSLELEKSVEALVVGIMDSEVSTGIITIGPVGDGVMVPVVFKYGEPLCILYHISFVHPESFLNRTYNLLASSRRSGPAALQPVYKSTPKANWKICMMCGKNSRGLRGRATASRLFK